MSAAFITIHDYKTSKSEGILRYAGPITSEIMTIGRAEMGLTADLAKGIKADITVSSKTMKCHVDENGNILAYGVMNGTPWSLNDGVPEPQIQLYNFQNDKQGNQLPFVVAPESKRKLVHWTMKLDYVPTKSEPKWEQKYEERRLVFEFTNNNKAVTPPVVKQMTEVDNDMLERMQNVETVVKEMTEVDNDMLERMQNVENKHEHTTKRIKKLGVTGKELADKMKEICKEQYAHSLKIDKAIVDINEIRIQQTKAPEKGDETKALIKKKDEQNAQTIKDLRASMKNLEEKNEELQKSQAAILLTVQTLQNVVDMMKTSIDSRVNAMVDTAGNAPPVAQVTVNNPVDENNEQVDETEDEEESDADSVAKNTSTTVPIGTLDWNADETQEEEQTLLFTNMDVEQNQSEDEKQAENQLPSDDTSEDQMEEVDDEEMTVKKRKTRLTSAYIALNRDDEASKEEAEKHADDADDEAPKEEAESPKLEGDDLVEPIYKIVREFLKTCVRYTDITLKELWPVVAEKLDGYNKDIRDDLKECRKYIIQAYDRCDAEFKSEKRIKEADEAREEAEKQTEQHIEPIVYEEVDMSGFKMFKINVIAPKREVWQTPLKFFRKDIANAKLLDQWSETASSEVYKLGKKPTEANVHAYIKDYIWDNAKKDLPEFKLAEYEKGADDWNATYEKERTDAAKKRSAKGKAASSEESPAKKTKGGT